MKKKIIALCLIVALAATAVIGGTLAYFTDKDAATNTFTVGNVNIELTEPKWTSSGSQDAPEVYPGEPLAKDPTVENIGKNPCFVRIKVEGLDCLNSAGAGDIIYRTGSKNNKLGEGWEKHGDYFYWTKPLIAAGTENDSWNTGLVSKTNPLFDQIVIPTDLTNGDGKEAFNVVVTAEAVQAQGAAPSWSNTVNGKHPVKEMTVAEIAAWFDTCMSAPTVPETTAATEAG